MSEAQPNSQGKSSRSVNTVMNQVSRAAQSLELESLVFVSCQFSFDESEEGEQPDMKIRFANQDVVFQDSLVRVEMMFEFLAPSPVPDDERQVDIRAKFAIDYSMRTENSELDEADADVFARVNGIYNAWPYLREFVRSSLGRLGLPSFELPLLRVQSAVRLAGLLEVTDSPDTEA